MRTRTGPASFRRTASSLAEALLPAVATGGAPQSDQEEVSHHEHPNPTALHARIAVRFEYEWHDEPGQWYRSYGNEMSPRPK